MGPAPGTGCPGVIISMTHAESSFPEIEITSEMVVAGVERLRESGDEFDQSSADAVVVLEILETALLAR